MAMITRAVQRCPDLPASMRRRRSTSRRAEAATEREDSGEIAGAAQAKPHHHLVAHRIVDAVGEVEQRVVERQAGEVAGEDPRVGADRKGGDLSGDLDHRLQTMSAPREGVAEHLAPGGERLRLLHLRPLRAPSAADRREAASRRRARRGRRPATR